MSRTLPAVALLLAFAVLAGCFGKDDTPAPPVVEQPPAPSITTIAPLAEPVLVTLPDHRIAEFMVNRDPNDPDHLVTAYGDYDSYGGTLNCGFSVSKDGGATWVVANPIEGFAGPHLEFDGWVDFDEQGGVHAICLRESGPETTTETWPFYFNSADGGLTWKDVMHIPTEPAGRSTDKSVLAVGRDGTVYAAVSDILGTTNDNGTTWVPMTDIMGSKDGRPVPASVGVLNGMVEDNLGTMYLLGLGSGDSVWVGHSSDKGVSWTAAEFGAFQIPPGYNDQNRWVRQEPWTAVPTMAHDPVSDEVWVTYQSWDEGYGGYLTHIWRSTDHGASFAETAVPAFASPACSDPCHVTHPALAFDLDGRVGLIAQLTKDEGIVKVVQFSASDDHGATWLAPFELSSTDGTDSWRNPNAFAPGMGNAQAIATGVAADPRTAHNVALGLGLSTAVSELQMRWNGEYWGLAATSKGFVAMWIDHSNDGRPQLYSRLLKVE
ncbi:MAG: repeat-like domain [Thermoplasmata archaeon]|jgi:hypothetical protein|nr:repeat-like domain [Thermoplasmata archaeon]MEA3165189.1 repeat-like domain [Thermoplasmata archaeon]